MEIKEGDWVLAHCDTDSRYIGKYIGVYKHSQNRYQLSDWRCVFSDGSLSRSPMNGGVFCHVEPIDIIEFLFNHINKLQKEA